MNYFAVTVKFPCASCHKMSIEQLVTEADNSDPNPVVLAVQQQKFKCQLCAKPMTNGTQVDIRVQPATLEELKRWGFSPPPSN